MHPGPTAACSVSDTVIRSAPACLSTRSIPVRGGGSIADRNARSRVTNRSPLQEEHYPAPVSMSTDCLKILLHAPGPAHPRHVAAGRTRGEHLDGQQAVPPTAGQVGGIEVRGAAIGGHVQDDPLHLIDVVQRPRLVALAV